MKEITIHNKRIYAVQTKAKGTMDGWRDLKFSASEATCNKSCAMLSVKNPNFKYRVVTYCANKILIGD